MNRIICILLFTISLQITGEVKTQKYRIKVGDTLAGIALQHQVSVAYLLKLNNQLKNPDRIYAGQPINVPLVTEELKNISQQYKNLIVQMGAQKYRDRKAAIDKCIELDWRVVPLLVKALKNKDVEIRENARETLREIHRKKEAATIN